MRLLIRGGKIDIICSLSSFMVFMFNLINQIITGKDIFSRLPYTAPFLILSIIFLFYSSQIFRFIIFSIIGFFITISAENISDFSGAILFVFAFNQIKTGRSAIILSLAVLISITIRSIIMDDTISGNLVMLVIYFFVAGIYYFSMYQKDEPNRWEDLLEDENRLLSLLSFGRSQKEAAEEMDISTAQANNIIKRIRRKTGVDSLHRILFLYGAKNSDEK